MKIKILATILLFSMLWPGTPEALDTVPVTVSDSAPAASDDQVKTYINVPMNFNLLRNDSGSGTLVVSEVTQASHGTVTINSDQTIRYVPNAGFKGQDNFTYTIRDTGGLTASANVQVNVTEFLILRNFHPERLTDDRMRAYDGIFFAGSIDFTAHQSTLEQVARYRALRPDGLVIQEERWDLMKAKPKRRHGRSFTSPMPDPATFEHNGIHWNPEWIARPRKGWPTVNQVKAFLERHGFELDLEGFLNVGNHASLLGGRTDYLPYVVGIRNDHGVRRVSFDKVKVRVSAPNYLEWRIAYVLKWRNLIHADLVAIGTGKHPQYWDDDMTNDEDKRGDWIAYYTMINEPPPFGFSEHFAPSDEPFINFSQGFFDLALHPDLQSVPRFGFYYHLAAGRSQRMIERYRPGEVDTWFNANTDRVLDQMAMATFPYRQLSNTGDLGTRSKELAQRAIDHGQKLLLLGGSNLPDPIGPNIPYTGRLCLTDLCRGGKR